MPLQIDDIGSYLNSKKLVLYQIAEWIYTMMMIIIINIIKSL